MSTENVKSIFASKSFWVNLIALAGMLLQAFTGSEVLVNVETQATILAVINIVLRTITKEAVTWK